MASIETPRTHNAFISQNGTAPESNKLQGHSGGRIGEKGPEAESVKPVSVQSFNDGEGGSSRFRDFSFRKFLSADWLLVALGLLMALAVWAYSTIA